ncbi:MAG: hypothetical protein QF464_22025, partial [Myxococcota bacterium]|nr:hypothetical protein [Myxococcota bacterium]
MTSAPRRAHCATLAGLLLLSACGPRGCDPQTPPEEDAVSDTLTDTGADDVIADTSEATPDTDEPDTAADTSEATP